MTQNRIQQGVPRGGQFAATGRTEAAGGLSTRDPWDLAPLQGQQEEWRDHAFEPDEAEQWATHGWSAPDAAAWRDAGFASGESTWWAGRQFAPDEAAPWRAMGIPAQEAHRHKANGVSPKHPLLGRPKHTFSDSSNGWAAARDAVEELRASGDDHAADRIELARLASDIQKNHPSATHVIRDVASDSVGVSAVRLGGDTSIASGWHSISQPYVTDEKHDPLSRMARIAGRPGSVLARMERIDKPSGWRVISLDEMSLLAANLPRYPSNTQAELDEVTADLATATGLRKQQILTWRRRQLERWQAFSSRTAQEG